MPAHPPAAPAGSHRPDRILVADDHALTRQLVALILEDLGSILQARSGAQALELCRALSPELVILDLTMPGGLSGIDACRALRADSLTATLPIILYTGSSRRDHAAACLRAGATAFLTKPFQCATLEGLARTLLSAAGAPP